MDVKVGVIYSRLHPIVSPGQFAAQVESMGFDSLWVTEGLANQKAALDPLITLSAFAGATSRITIGSCVLIAPLRTPALLAKSAASIDVLSGGRLVLGVGVGGSSLSNSADYDACGIDPRTRGARCDELIELLKRFWSGQTVDFDGRFYSVTNVQLAPQPVQLPGPALWAGGEADGVLQRTARFCNGFVPMGRGPAHYESLWNRVCRYAEQYDRDPTQIEKAVHIYYCSDSTRAHAHEVIEKTLTERYGFEVKLPDDGMLLAGSADDCIRIIADYAAAGVEHFVINTARPIEEVPDDIERFAEKVLPRLRAG